MRIEGYATLIFDCDGVVLDSNRVKTEAFRTVVASYGPEAAEALVAYHIANGGVSRYEKFRYFLDVLVPAGAGPGYEELLTRFSDAVRHGLLSCSVTSGLDALRSATPDARWMIVSGGDQCELRKVFAERGIAGYFDGGIFGSPADKRFIIRKQRETSAIQGEALFLGDSRMDHEVSISEGLDFIFVSQWTEFSHWKKYCAEREITVISEPKELLCQSLPRGISGE